jgi:hypothetical protein
MTPYEHRWAWAKSLNVSDMDDFIARYQPPMTGSIVITYKGVTATHVLSDVMEAVLFCREEYRKDQRMTHQRE